MSKINIFVTLGPSSLNKKFLTFIQNKASLVRLNMSHIKIHKLEKRIVFIKKNINKTLSEFKNRFIVTKVPNIVEIVYGRKVGYKVKKILTKPYFRNISASKIRKDLRKRGLI